MSRTVLYIDRDPTVRLLLQKGLAPAGFEVLEAEDPAHGRALARKARPDAVIVDLDAVDMPPAAVVEALRGAPELEAAPLFASTAEDRPEHLQYTTSCGFTAVLVKPLDVDALASQLEPHVQPRAVGEAPAPPPADAGRAGVEPLVLHALGPLLESLIERVSVADAVVLLDVGVEGELVVAAAHSVRRGTVLPAHGTRVTPATTPWLAEGLRSSHPAVIDGTAVAPSPLVSDGTTSLLVVPLGERGKHGAVVLGERRRRAFAFPPAQVEEIVAEAGRLAIVIEQLRRLPLAIAEARREVERYRVQVTRAIAAGGMDKRDEHHDAVVDLSVRVAETLGLGAEEVESVRHRAELHDAGIAWLRHAVLPHVQISPEVRDRLLRLRGELEAEICGGLGWPMPGAPADPTDTAARVVATVTAYFGRLAGTARRPSDQVQAVAALRKEASGAAERRVVDALATVVGPAAAVGGN
jgi:CheY-like chemotaxis protein